MNVQDFLNLKPGTVLMDRQFGTYGEVLEGPWQNCLQDHLKGSGQYIKWDDGDGCEVGLALHLDQDIAHFEIVEGPIT